MAAKSARTVSAVTSSPDAGMAAAHTFGAAGSASHGAPHPQKASLSAVKLSADNLLTETDSRPMSTLDRHHTDFAVPAVDTHQICEFGRVVVAGLVACSTWAPSDQHSSRMARSTASPCPEASSVERM